MNTQTKNKRLKKQIESTQRALAYLGLPLTIEAKEIKRTPQNLTLLLVRYCALISKKPKELLRELDALKALLLAIYRQYPTFFKKNLLSKKNVTAFFPKKVTGKIIKLKRIAEAKIALYL